MTIHSTIVYSFIFWYILVSCCVGVGQYLDNCSEGKFKAAIRMVLCFFVWPIGVLGIVLFGMIDSLKEAGIVDINMHIDKFIERMRNIFRRSRV